MTPNSPDDPLPYYYRPFVGGLFRQRLRQALSLLRPSYDSVLEVGYGSGILMPSLAAVASARLEGIDLTSSPETVARDLAPLGVRPTLRNADVAKLPYAGGEFDLVVAISIFEHIADPSPAIAEIARVLRPGGEFLVGMPRVDRLMSSLFAAIGFGAIDRHHVTTWRSFRRHALAAFEPVSEARVPSFVPSWGGVYFNLLFRKPAAPRSA